MQLAAYVSVPFAIGCDFICPIFSIAAWKAAAFRAAMPKAAIDEHHNTLAPEGEIGFAQQRLIAAPTRYAKFFENGD